MANQSQNFPTNGRFLRILNSAFQAASNKQSEWAHGTLHITVKEDEAPRKEEIPSSYLEAQPESR